MPSNLFTRLPISIKKQNGELGYRGGVYTARIERSSPRANMPRTRGIVGADPTELKLREAAARKKAFEKECYDAAGDGEYGNPDDIDEVEMAGLLEEMMQFEKPRRASVQKEADDGRKKSFVARMMSRGG